MRGACSKAPHSKLHSSATPFGTKVEVMLRVAGLPYTAQMADVRDPSISPKQKVLPSPLTLPPGEAGGCVAPPCSTLLAVSCASLYVDRLL